MITIQLSLVHAYISHNHDNAHTWIKTTSVHFSSASQFHRLSATGHLYSRYNPLIKIQHGCSATTIQHIFTNARIQPRLLMTKKIIWIIYIVTHSHHVKHVQLMCSHGYIIMTIIIKRPDGLTLIRPATERHEVIMLWCYCHVPWLSHTSLCLLTRLVLQQNLLLLSKTNNMLISTPFHSFAPTAVETFRVGTLQFMPIWVKKIWTQVHEMTGKAAFCFREFQCRRCSVSTLVYFTTACQPPTAWADGLYQRCSYS